MAGLNWLLVNGNLQWGGTIAVGDGTAAAPPLTFASATTKGIFSPSAAGIGVASLGVEIYRFNADGSNAIAGSNASLQFGADMAHIDTWFGRDGAANVLALKNGTAAQTLRVYGSTATVDRYLAASCSTGGVGSLRPVNITLSTTAAGNKVNIGSSDLTGYLMCGTSTGAPGLIAILGALSTTAEINDPKTSYSVVGGTTNMINVYWDSTAAQYAIENQTGTNASVSAIFLGR